MPLGGGEIEAAREPIPFLAYTYVNVVVDRLDYSEEFFRAEVGVDIYRGMVACGGREGGREGGRQAGRERGRKREGGKGGDGKKVEKRPLKSLVPQL